MPDCCCGDERTCCGPDRCLPNQECNNPLPSTLRITVTGTFSGGDCTCLEIDSTLTFYGNGADNPHTGTANVWTMGFTLCDVSYRYSLSCVTDSDGWKLSFLNGNGSGANPGNCLEAPSISLAKASCNPLVLSGTFDTAGIGCCGASHLTGLATLTVTIWEE
jgi:hypothetical protein